MPHSVSESTSRTMSVQSSVSSVDAFPKQSGVALQAPGATGDQLSPSRSTFSSFDMNSPPKSRQGSDKAADFDNVKVARPTSHGVVAERKSSIIPVHQKAAPRKLSQYYQEKFALRDDSTAARERVTKDAPIVAELRTNVIIKDEYTLVTDLSHHLSTRYQRPECSIMISINHSACILLGGSFEPTYVFTINALSAQLQPTINKRNAAMIQAFMTESIGVAADRGVIRFIPISEDNLATNGMTIAGDIEQYERLQEDQEGGLKRSLTKNSRKSSIIPGSRKSSIIPGSRKASIVPKTKGSAQHSRSSSNNDASAKSPISPPVPKPGPFDSAVAVNEDGADQLAPLAPKESFHSRKSSMAHIPSHKIISDKVGTETSTVASNNNGNSSPEDESQPKLGKRKSFMTMFRR